MLITKSDCVYISGRMSGIPDFNRKAFIDAEKFLRSNYNCGVLNPAHLINQNISYDECMNIDMACVKACSIVLLLPNYALSKGAMAEVGYAQCLGKKILILDKIKETLEVS